MFVTNDWSRISSAHTVPEGRPSSSMCSSRLKILSRETEFQPCLASASTASSRPHFLNNFVSSSSMIPNDLFSKSSASRDESFTEASIVIDRIRAFDAHILPKGRTRLFILCLLSLKHLIRDTYSQSCSASASSASTRSGSTWKVDLETRARQKSALPATRTACCSS